jgi:hypothetical protein
MNAREIVDKWVEAGMGELHLVTLIEAELWNREATIGELRAAMKRDGAHSALCGLLIGDSQRCRACRPYVDLPKLIESLEGRQA